MENHHKNCLSTTLYGGPCNCEDLEVVVCTDCHGEVSEKFDLTVCEGCGNIEQGTEVWCSERFEREGSY